MSDWFDKKIVGSILIILMVVSIGYVAWNYGISPALQAAQPPPVITPVYTYTQGLTVSFRVLDTTDSVPVTTDDGFAVAFYSVTADPFDLVSMDTPIAVGASDAVTGVWMAVLDAGTYKALVVDDTTVYPVLQTVTVPGTNDADMEVNLNPYMLNVVQRSTPDVAVTIYSYNDVTGLYDTEETDITDPGSLLRWQVTYTISAPGLRTEIAEGRLYLTTYTGLSITSVKVNNVAGAVVLDSEGSDDGLTGPYIAYSAIPGGSSVTIQVVLTRTAALADGTYSALLYEKYDCHNVLLRWWTDETADIDVVAAT